MKSKWRFFAEAAWAVARHRHNASLANDTLWDTFFRPDRLGEALRLSERQPLGRVPIERLAAPLLLRHTAVAQS